MGHLRDRLRYIHLSLGFLQPSKGGFQDKDNKRDEQAYCLSIASDVRTRESLYTLLNNAQRPGQLLYAQLGRLLCVTACGQTLEIIQLRPVGASCTYALPKCPAPVTGSFGLQNKCMYVGDSCRGRTLVDCVAYIVGIKRTLLSHAMRH